MSRKLGLRRTVSEVRDKIDSQKLRLEMIATDDRSRDDSGKSWGWK